MDNKFLLAIVWVMGVAAVASLVYLVGDILRWGARRAIAGLDYYAPDLIATCAGNTRARGLFGSKNTLG